MDMEKAQAAIAQVIGVAAIEVVRAGDPVTNEALTRMIEVLYIEEMDDLAVEFALDLLRG